MRDRLPTRALLGGGLLLALALRLANLTTFGLQHDEVAHWLINNQIIAGRHAVYFTDAYGHEAAYHYVQTLFQLLLGDNAFALRLPSVLLGVLGVAVAYALTRALYGPRVALLAALIVAVTFYPIFQSRQALRAIMLPLTAGLAGVALWRGLYGAPSAAPRRLALAGALVGLSLHTYLASRALPLFVALWLAGMLLWDRSRLRARARGVAALVALAALTAAPLLIWLALNPTAEFRVAEVSAPLDALRAGNMRPVLDNALRIAGVWGWTGDPLWRQNVAHAPVFAPPLALLFYAGVARLLWRRQARDLFVLLWLATATLPSVVTIDAPSTIRMVLLLPLLGAPVALAAQAVMHRMTALSTEKGRLSTPNWRFSWITVLTIALLFELGRGWYFAQRVWPASTEVAFVWQRALTDAAAWLDAQPQVADAQIIGWTPLTLDPPTMQLALTRHAVALRYGAPDVLVLAGGGRQGATLLRPLTPDLPLAAALEAQLRTWGAQTAASGGALVYALPPFDVAPPIATAADFGGELALLGHTACQPAADGCHLLTFWRVLAPPAAPRSIFLHALAADGTLRGQSDGLSSPPQFWAAGDVIVRAHVLPADFSRAQVGVYDPAGNRRLTLPDGRDALPLDLRP